MKYIDLSYKIEEGMPVYPGDMEVLLTEEKNYKRDKYTSYILKTGLHIGTHIDCPMHLTEDKRYISEFPVDRFIGEAAVLDVRGKKEIKIEEGYKELLENKEIVILYTGFEEKYGIREYYDNHPTVSEELAKYFVDNKVKMVGFDMPSPDRYPFEIHKILLVNNIFILENLCNLESLLDVETFKIIALPLKIEGEGSLVRAVAIAEDM
ncbi:cyclase family protein [Clostridium paraputrificum]|uniref:cyclase family protein n=1 Tax=Clostridium paraputrificum TaxID=29363 RepID=UPI003D32B110